MIALTACFGYPQTVRPGSLPLWLRGTGRWNAMAIDVLTFFTGGVFLGAGMLHMLPEAAEQAEEAGITSPLLNPFTCFCVGLG